MTFPGIDRKQKLLAVILIIIFAFGVARFIPETSFARLATIKEEIEQGGLNRRMEIWYSGLEVFQEEPCHGIGAGAFKAALGRLVGWRTVAHNTFVSVLVEQGIVGLTLFLAILWTLIWGGNLLGPPERRLWLFVGMTWCVGVMTLTWEAHKVTWLLFGLLLASSGKAIAHDRTRSMQSIRGR